MSALKVGDTIYRFDVNRRVYRQNAEGRSHGSPIYSEYFRPYVIGAETPKSWIISAGYGEPLKINKKTMLSHSSRGFSPFQWYTPESMSDDIWRNVHRMPITELMRSASADQLREIGKILGYDPDRKETEND